MTADTGNRRADVLKNYKKPSFPCVHYAPGKRAFCLFVEIGFQVVEFFQP